MPLWEQLHVASDELLGGHGGRAGGSGHCGGCGVGVGGNNGGGAGCDDVGEDG